VQSTIDGRSPGHDAREFAELAVIRMNYSTAEADECNRYKKSVGPVGDS